MSLIARLQGLSSPEIVWYPAGDFSLVGGVEASRGVTFPDDYREVMRERNGFTLSQHKTALELESASGLDLQDCDERFEERLPGMIVFGDNSLAWRNENLLLANPITLAAFPLGPALALGSPRVAATLRAVWFALAATSVSALVAKALPMSDQDNWRLIAVLLPLNLGMAAATVLYCRRSGRGRRPGCDPTSVSG